MDTFIPTLQSYAVNFRKERCGVILEDLSIIEINNVSANVNSFIFSKMQWINLLKSNANIKCIWHTHPKHSPEPSAADIATGKKLKYDMLVVTEDTWRYVKCAS